MLDLLAFSKGRKKSALLGLDTTRKRVKLCLLSCIWSCRIFSPYNLAAEALQMAAHPLHLYLAIYSAEPAVSSASTALMSG